MAVVSENYIVTDGVTPTRDVIQKIVDWAYQNTEKTIFISRSFLKDFGGELGLDETTGGIVIYFVEKSKNELLIWFRK